MSGRRLTFSSRRGSALVTVLIIVMLLGFTVVGVVGVGARDQDLTVRRLDTARAFYAAEAGMNMAIRELMLDIDEDGDGGVGTISDDDDPATDPSFGSASVSVSLVVTAGRSTLVSKGVSGQSRRHIEASPGSP